MEETFDWLKFDILRSQGSQGKVTVDLVTLPGSATADPDHRRAILAPLDEGK